MYLKCPFVDGEPMAVDIEEIGECDIGDVLSSETGGWSYIQYNEINDLSEEGKKVFFEFIESKGFHYSNLEKYGFIAD
ncbi:MAG: hypothetical protein Q4D51_09220 [Eubacteriales bacterium]|nr:hypothetical protein [Eubacteriales bacterium]